MIKRMGLSVNATGRFQGLGLVVCCLWLGACWDPLVREVFENEPGGSASTPGELGDACIPEDDDYPTFAGFSVYEVSISTGDARCATGTCLVDRFQGRASCPDGNVDGGECFTPSGALVTVDVEPHLPDRPAAEVVLCSCRCGGPAEFGPFCECPGDMRCLELEGPYDGDGTDNGQGSYCVRR
jgi:hypothetical protein